MTGMSSAQIIDLKSGHEFSPTLRKLWIQAQLFGGDDPIATAEKCYETGRRLMFSFYILASLGALCAIVGFVALMAARPESLPVGPGVLTGLPVFGALLILSGFCCWWWARRTERRFKTRRGSVGYEFPLLSENIGIETKDLTRLTEETLRTRATLVLVELAKKMLRLERKYGHILRNPSAACAEESTNLWNQLVEIHRNFACFNLTHRWVYDTYFTQAEHELATEEASAAHGKPGIETCA